MEFAPDGSVQVCCANYLYPIGEVGRASLREIWSGTAAQQLRAAVGRGDLSLGCTICRFRLAHHSAEVPLRGYAHLTPIGDATWPSRLSFSLRNTCNLECVMCGGDRSSRIRAHRHGLPALPARYGKDFFDQLPEFIAHTGWCDFVGGEPLLIREHWQVWDIMREVAPGVKCAITTNGTVWNDRVEGLLDDFPTTVRLSMDGITETTFQSIRVGADLATFSRNFERFHTYCRDRRTELSISWSFIRQNWFELGDALMWADSRDVPVYVTTVMERDFGVQHLPTDDLTRVNRRLTEQSGRIRPHLRLNRDEWDRQLEMVRTELDRRSSDHEPGTCFEAPTPDAAGRAARVITEHDWGAVAASTAPSLAGYAAAWLIDLDGAERLVCDPHGRVLEHSPGTAGVLDGLVVGRDDLAAALSILCRHLDGHLWRFEDLTVGDGLVSVIGVGPLVRDGEAPAIIRLLVSARRSPNGDVTALELAVATAAGLDREAVSVSIRQGPPSSARRTADELSRPPTPPVRLGP